MSNLLQGAPVMNAFNSIGVAASGLGSHEFDWGLDTVTGSGTAKYPIICSNLFYKGTNKRVFEPYKILKKDGVKIAVVGAIGEDLPNIVLADLIKDYDAGSIVDNVSQAAMDARAKGAQIVIALIHAGDNSDDKTGPVFDVTNRLGGAVDAVLGGETLDVVNTAAANGTPVAIATAFGEGFIDMKITLQSDGKLTFSTAYIDNNTDSTVFPYGYKASSPVVDQAVSDIVNAAKKEAGPIANQKLGIADTNLTIAQEGSPLGESLAGNWACDVMKAEVNADFAINNNGLLCADIPQGVITRGTLYAFLPFDDTITTADMTGAQIKALLEQAVGDNGKGIQAAGLTFTYNPGAPSGSRVVSISKTNGTPIDMTDTSKTYKVATNNFVSTGGDGFAIYKTITSFDTHILIRDAFAENIQQAGHISSQIQGRIKTAQNADMNKAVTRAKFTGMLAHALGLIEDESAGRFSDVLPGQPLAGMVGAAVKAGLVSGYEDGTFRPDAPISREEMAVMAIRAIKAAGFNTEVSNANTVIAKFKDADRISGWAKIPVAAAVEAGIIGGKDSGDFAPSGHVTRAEAEAVLDRVQGYRN